tara:strand:+ start:126 stop:1244 length:1119 start_codon:yes stop_codon:yes gene_type:complete
MGDEIVIEDEDIGLYKAREKKTYIFDSLLGTRKRKYTEDRSLIRFQNRVLITGAIGIVVAWFYIRLAMVEKVYKAQFEQYYDTHSHFNSSPEPLGMTNFTIREITIASEFPQFYSKVLVSTMSAKTISICGAKFLLIMLARFPNDITRDMWSGSPEQLLPSRLHARAGGFLHSFDSWNVPKNRFRWLCKTRAEFDTHIAIQCRLRGATGREGNLIEKVVDDVTESGSEVQASHDILHSLYNGGLCEVARFHTSASTTPAELLHKVAGLISLTHVDCRAQRAMQVAGTASNVAGAGMTGLGIISTMAGGSLFAGPLSIAATLGVVAGSIVTGIFMAERTKDATICTPPTGAHMVDKENYTYDDLTCGNGAADS